MGKSRGWVEGHLEGVGRHDKSHAGHFECGEVPEGHLSGDVRVCTRGSFLVTLGTPAVALSPLPGLRPSYPPSQALPGVMAALNLLRRTVFQKGPLCQRGPHGSLPVSGRSRPGPH